MHSAQDAIAAMYSLLQLHGSFMAQQSPDGHNAICATAEAMIASLKVAMLTICLHAKAAMSAIKVLIITNS